MYVNKFMQNSGAEIICSYTIVLICNIMMAVCHRYLYLQTPIYQVDLTICFCTLNPILLYIIEKGTCFCKCLFLAQKERLELSRRFAVIILLYRISDVILDYVIETGVNVVALAPDGRAPFAGYCVEIVVLYVCALEARLAADDIPVGGVCSVAATLI